MTLAEIGATARVLPAPVPPPAGVPVIVGIGLDETTRRRLATHVAGIGVVMFTPDVATAHHMLCGGAETRQDVAADDDGDRIVRVGDLEVDQVRCRAFWRGEPLSLSKQERDLLAHLVTEPARVWTYRQLHAAAWDCHYTDAGPVRAAVKRLRRKLGQAGVPVRIEAVRGIGYQFAGSGDDR